MRGVRGFINMPYCERIVPGTFNLLSRHVHNLSVQSELSHLQGMINCLLECTKGKLDIVLHCGILSTYKSYGSTE